ncbi:RxLR effector protein [Phytophthora megakarya]|uniref:RxLR effector protein n=1 Tax=Phytophthora megakarya TaxID=4795 RepID=A0A225WRG2_9STRA|nr:RxLR effector protein [Phytophthora megakarya]
MRGTLFYCIYVLLVVVVFSSNTPSIATSIHPDTTAATKYQSITIFQAADNTNRVLRSHYDVDKEDRTVTNLTNKAKIWFTNTKFAHKAKPLLVAFLLHLPFPPNRLIVKMGVHPDEVYKTLGLQKGMTTAYNYGTWKEMKANPRYKKWRNYQRAWFAQHNAL